MQKDRCVQDNNKGRNAEVFLAQKSEDSLRHINALEAEKELKVKYFCFVLPQIIHLPAVILLMLNLYRSCFNDHYKQKRNQKR